MGYYTYFTGSVDIHPQIPESMWPTDYTDQGDAFFILEQVDGDEDVQIVGGRITVVGTAPSFTRAKIRWDESVKGYSFDEDLTKFTGWLTSRNVKANGFFDGDGEESDDFWRATVRDNVVTQERGEIIYPSERYAHLLARGRAPMNHGKVIPRPDSKYAKCGGLSGNCDPCKEDLAWLTKTLYGNGKP